MKREVRKVSLLALVAVLVCSAIFSVVSILPKTPVIAQNGTVSTSKIIGEKTDNVTVSVAQTKGSYTGLLLTRTGTDDMKAHINTTFTNSANISFLFVGSETNDAHSFSVYNKSGVEVLRYVTFYRNAWQAWGCRGYVYAPLDNDGNGAYYTTSANGPVEFTNFSTVDSNSSQRIMPVAGATNLNSTLTDWDYKYYLSTLLANLSFEYVDGTLTCQINTPQVVQNGDGSDYAGTNSTPTVTMASIDVDLSDGFTVSINSEVNAVNKTGNYSTCKPVLLTEINGVSLTSGTFEVVDSTYSNIQYKGEKVVDDKNIISLKVGEYLDSFTYDEVLILKDINSNLISLNPIALPFDCSNNKEFVSDEEITIEYLTLSKTYYIDVTDGIAVSVSDIVVAKANATVTPNITSNGFTGVQIARTNASALPFSAMINGKFYGNSSITFNYSARRQDAHAFTVYDANGNEVASIINYFTNVWQKVGAQSYLYNALTGKYTAPTTSGYNEITLLPGYHDSSIVKLSPAAAGYDFTGVNITTKNATIYFEYENNVLTIKQADIYSKVYTLGVVNVDLSDGYIISLGSCDNLLSGEGVTSWPYEYNENSLPIILMAINGRSLGGESVLTDSYSTSIVCDNGEEVVENKNVVTVVQGEEVTFSAALQPNFKSLKLNAIAGEKLDVAVATNEVGTFNKTVSFANVTKDYIINVITYADSLTGVEMQKGAYIRFGSANDGSDRGLRFAMNVSTELQAELDAKVAENYLTDYSYGMFIVPYDYIATYGDFTVSAFFGDNATYTWKDKVGAGSVQVLNLTGDKDSLIDNVLYGAIISLKVDAEKGINNVTRAFVGLGYIKLDMADGTTQYRLVSAYKTYATNGNVMDATNNVRSAYEVAVAAYNSPMVSETQKQAIYSAYLEPNGYKGN